MRLIDNWKETLKRANTARLQWLLMLVSGLSIIAEQVVPTLQAVVSPTVFSALTFVSAALTLVLRVIKQKDLD